MTDVATGRTETVDVDGARVTFYDSVTAVSGGRTLVLVHGTGGSTQQHFGHLFPMMATRTRVVGIDLAPLPDGEELTLSALVRQVRAATDTALGPEASFDLLGYSLGSVVATALAAELGQRVRNLVLVAGWIKTDLQQMLRNEVWQFLYESSRRALGRYTAVSGLSAPFLRQVPPPVLESLMASLKSDEFTRQQMELNAAVDLTEQAGRITSRTLIVSCRDDFMVPPHHQLQLLGVIDDARLTHISSGHAVFVERPAQLMQVTDLFLRESGLHPAGAVIPEAQP